MANWYGTSRSNYFKVKDVEAFTADMDKHGIEYATKFKDKNDVFAVFGGDDGFFNSSYHDEATDDYVDFELIDVIMPHLPDNEVCVLQSAGAEKLRYITGYAQAFTNKNLIQISIDDIYEKAAKEFNVPLDSISQASY